MWFSSKLIQFQYAHTMCVYCIHKKIQIQQAYNCINAKHVHKFFV